MARGLIPSLLICLLGLSGVTRSTAQNDVPPNIVLIISDDQAWGDYSFMGHPQIKTPRLDRLAGESLLFTRGYVPASLCCPSLASIITGLQPHQHKITSNDPPVPDGMSRGAFYKTPDFQKGREVMTRHLEAVGTLPKWLATRGYVSLQTGKWWQGHYLRGGFTDGMTMGRRHGDDGLVIGRKTMQPIFDFVEAAQRDKKPFFIWYAPFLPHAPHTPPDRLLQKYKALTESEAVARYWGNVEWFDETTGQLLDFIDAKGLTDNTIVVYVADNGWVQNPNLANRFAPRSKQSPYDGGLRTPIMIRWPARVKPAKSDRLASSLDIAPTLLKAAGLKVDPKLSGVDLLDADAVSARKSIYGACYTHDAINLNNPAENLRWRWVINGSLKLIDPAPWNEPDGKPELYDLSADPHEEHDMAADQPGEVARLKALLDAWWTPEL